MKKLWDEIFEGKEEAKRIGAFDLNRKPCFAEPSIDECDVLKEKYCYGCAFYKADGQVKESKEKANQRLKSLRYKSVVYFKNRNAIPNISPSYIAEKYGVEI